MSLQSLRHRIDGLVVTLFWTITITILALNFPVSHSFSTLHDNNHASSLRSTTMNALWSEYRNQSPKSHESVLRARESLPLFPVRSRALLLRSSRTRCRALSSILYAESDSFNPKPNSNTMVIPMNMESSDEVAANENSTEMLPFIAENQEIQIDQISPKSRDNSNSITMKDKLIIASATAALFVAFLGLLSAAGPGGWRYYLAGGFCAALSHAVATPIDVVKTRKQVDPELINTSFAKATSRIVEEEGPSALLSGLGPTTMGYFFEGSLKFGIYEILKPAAQRALTFLANGTGWALLQSQFLSFVVCGAISGIAASLILCPLEAIRIRRVAEPSSLQRSWVEGGYQMVKTEGISALSKGLVPMLYKQVPYTISKNVAFDILTRASYGLWRTGGWRITNTCKIVIPLVCAIFTSILSTLGSQPGDVLLSLVNAHEGNKRTNDFVRELWPQGGIRAFFVGTKSRLLHVGIIVTLQLILYDAIKRLAGIAATGSV